MSRPQARHSSCSLLAARRPLLLLGACCRLPRREHDHALQRPARTDDRAARQPLRTQTGIKVEVRSDDEASLGNQILQEGSNSPADVFYTENTPALESLREHGLLAPVAPVDARRRARPLQLRAGRLGRRLRARVRARLQHLPARPARAAPLDPRTRPAAVEGQGRLRPVRDRLPAADHRDRQALRAAPPPNAGCKGLQANGHVYPDNETLVTQVNNGAERARRRSTTTTGTACATSSAAAAMHSALALLRARRPRRPDRRLRRGGAHLEQAPGRGAALPRVPRQPRRPRRSIAHSHSYEYPLRPGVAAAPGPAAAVQLRPASSTPAELGDGSAAARARAEARAAVGAR